MCVYSDFYFFYFIFLLFVCFFLTFVFVEEPRATATLAEGTWCEVGLGWGRLDSDHQAHMRGLYLTDWILSYNPSPSGFLAVFNTMTGRSDK